MRSLPRFFRKLYRIYGTLLLLPLLALAAAYGARAGHEVGYRLAEAPGQPADLRLIAGLGYLMLVGGGLSLFFRLLVRHDDLASLGERVDSYGQAVTVRLLLYALACLLCALTFWLTGDGVFVILFFVSYFLLIFSRPRYQQMVVRLCLDPLEEEIINAS